MVRQALIHLAHVLAAEKNKASNVTATIQVNSVNRSIRDRERKNRQAADEMIIINDTQKSLQKFRIFMSLFARRQEAFFSN